MTTYFQILKILKKNKWQFLIFKQVNKRIWDWHIYFYDISPMNSTMKSRNSEINDCNLLRLLAGS